MTDTRLSHGLKFLRAWCENEDDRSAYTLEYASFLMTFYPREAFPDWVEILANGDRTKWKAVIEIALEDMHEVEDDSSNL